MNLCIYHGNCADGFTSACVVKKAYKELEKEISFYPGVYQENPPYDIPSGSNILFVDFSYKRDVMKKLVVDGFDLSIIDHHKTAIEDLKDFPFKQKSFDIAKSGAMLTWEFFFPGTTAPLLVQHVQDRDLWSFKLSGTREIQAALFSFPYEFDVWTRYLEDDSLIEGLKAEGTAIERKHFKDIKELLKICRKRMMIAGHEVRTANLPYTMSSDAGHIMCKEEDEPFGACYWDTEDGRIFSLRSEEGRVDVSEIAKMFGGGGHRNAAGFKVSAEDARLMEL